MNALLIARRIPMFGVTAAGMVLLRADMQVLASFLQAYCPKEPGSATLSFLPS